MNNVYVDLSGSGVDGGMLEACVASVGVNRLLWGSDLTMDTGWAKLRYLELLLTKEELALVRWKNAASPAHCSLFFIRHHAEGSTPWPER